MPISATDRYAFAFGCAGGHVLSLDQLFKLQTADLRRCFECMIATWEKSIRQMGEGVDVARRHGSQDLARRLVHRVAALKERILLLQQTFLKDEA